jgi:hypothetical protein
MTVSHDEEISFEKEGLPWLTCTLSPPPSQSAGFDTSMSYTAKKNP